MSIRATALKWLRRWHSSASGTVRTSRFYPASLSWTKAPAWAFQVPLLDVIESPHAYVHLLCQKSDVADDFHYLKVPCSYLLSTKDKLFVYSIPGGDAISVFLGAEGDEEFRDARGKGRVTFRQFLVP
jgi:hypothetical protein